MEELHSMEKFYSMEELYSMMTTKFPSTVANILPRHLFNEKLQLFHDKLRDGEFLGKDEKMQFFSKKCYNKIPIEEKTSYSILPNPADFHSPKVDYPMVLACQKFLHSCEPLTKITRITDVVDSMTGGLFSLGFTKHQCTVLASTNKARSVGLNELSLKILSLIPNESKEEILDLTWQLRENIEKINTRKNGSGHFPKINYDDARKTFEIYVEDEHMMYNLPNQELEEFSSENPQVLDFINDGMQSYRIFKILTLIGDCLRDIEAKGHSLNYEELLNFIPRKQTTEFAF